MLKPPWGAQPNLNHHLMPDIGFLFNEREGQKISAFGKATKNLSSQGTNITWVSSPLGAIDFNGSDSVIDLGANKISPILSGARVISLATSINIDAVSGAQDLFVNFKIGGIVDAGIVMSLLLSGGGYKIRIGGRSILGEPFEFRDSDTVFSFGDQVNFIGILNYADDTISTIINGVLEGSKAVTFDNSVYTPNSPSATDTIGASFIGGFHADGKMEYLYLSSIDLTVNAPQLVFNPFPMFPRPSPARFFFIPTVTPPSADLRGLNAFKVSDQELVLRQKRDFGFKKDDLNLTFRPKR